MTTDPAVEAAAKATYERTHDGTFEATTEAQRDKYRRFAATAIAAADGARQAQTAGQRITRIPLTVAATATGQTTEGVLVGVMVSDLDALEATVEDLRAALDLANAPMTESEDRGRTNPSGHGVGPATTRGVADVIPFPAHHVPVSIDPHELSTTCWCDPTLEWENHHVVAVNHIDTDNGDS